MSHKSCCVPGCTVRVSEGILHYFPNPVRDAVRFKTWKARVGAHLVDLNDQYIFSNRRVCQRHFETVYHGSKHRLIKNAVPTLFLPVDLQGSCAMPHSVHKEVDQSFNDGTINAGVKTTIIHPATEKHIAKFSQQQSHIIVETIELYRNYTLPHIEKEQFNLQWVYNILEGKSEQDRVVHDNECEREGFVLLPDLKWDGVTRETLYLLAIVRRRGVKSLRDLDGEHLPLLKRLRDEGKKAIYDKYKVPGSQLRIYLHYQPSFYHLHVHFTYLKHEAPGIYAEKSHLLDTVIDNIEMMSNYYQKASLPFTIREMDNIFKVYETNGYIERIGNNIEDTELIDK